MRRRPTIPMLLAAALLGPLGAGCGPDNVTPCKEYVAARNQAYFDCGRPDQQIDADETCPETLNDGIDCTQYFQTLADSFECREGQVTWDTSGSCR